MRKKDEDNRGGLEEYFLLDKSSILQEIRVFNETPLKARRCALILTKFIALLLSGQSLGSNEATEAFFSVTKLFQSNDLALRRLVYMAIKELSTISESVLMVTSSLMKDMTGQGNDTTVYRANALRALCKIADASTLPSLERFFKQAIVDKNANVASAALVSAIHLFKDNKEVVRRWANEVQEASKNSNPSVQYHALGLMYLIRMQDKVALTKFLVGTSKGLRSHQAYVMLIRFLYRIIEDEKDENEKRPLFKIIEGLLRHGSDLVCLEAARAICAMSNLSSKDLFPAVALLQVNLNSSKAALRLASIRTLNSLAANNASVVSSCNVDMENLISDSNRNIATFAITTLLKTGNEASVDRLMKQISTFFSEISDEFKVIVIDAVRSLCVKFPGKHSSMMTFLSSILHDSGGFDQKKALIDAMLDIMEHVPEAKDNVLGQLSEFIEDCPHAKLLVRVLTVLGEQGPTSKAPSKCIRTIYNRIILENPSVRAAAIDALVKFAQVNEKMRPVVSSLLRGCLKDVDDDVRDRAVTFLKSSEYDVPLDLLYSFDTIYSLNTLESSLIEYLAQPGPSEPFDIKSIPLVTKAQLAAEKAYAVKVAQQLEEKSSLLSPSKHVAEEEPVSVILGKVPDSNSFGPCLKTCLPESLTESETEYVVRCFKHIFASHIVFQFNCKNTLNDVILQNVSVVMQPDEDIEFVASYPAKQLLFDQTEDIFMVYRYDKSSFPNVSFSNTLKYMVKDVDPSSGESTEDGYDDEYSLENVDLGLSDFVLPVAVPDFDRAWNSIGHEIKETFSLTAMKSIEETVKTVVDVMGLEPCNRTGSVGKLATAHSLLLSGMVVGGVRVLCRCRMAFEPSNGVSMELIVRSDSEEVSTMMANSVG